jgi:ATP phosphoribosyltransferase
MSIIIALPTGKSMETQTLSVLKEAGITVFRPDQRSIKGKVCGLPGIDQAIFCRPAEIPRLVTAGPAHIGITGEDIVFTRGLQYQLGILDAELEFSRSSNGDTRCVIFAKQEDPVSSLGELLTRAQGSVVATEYPVETKQFLDTCLGQEADFMYQEWSGSAEVAVVSGMARFGVALVETGRSLAVNGLREVEGAVIHRSKPIVIVKRGWSKQNYQGEAGKVLGTLSVLLSGVTQARRSVMLVMNVPRDALSALLAVLPSLTSPTVQPLVDGGYVSCSTVVPSSEANSIISEALLIGARDIIKLNPSVVG